MIIDIHTHIFPDELAPRALAVLTANAKITPHTDGTYAGLLASMQRAGVDRSVIMPIATKPVQVRSINSGAAAINRKQNGLISFGTLHPAQDDWQAEIDLLVADGIPGIKLHPEYQDFYVDDAALIAIYQGLARAGLILMFHAGVDIGLPPPVHCTPDRLARVLDAVPDLTVIAAHMGGYACWDDVERYLIGRSVYIDTSYSLGDLGAERMISMIRAHGVDRVLFGTDSPWTDQGDEVANIRGLGLSDVEVGKILGANAESLLG